MDETPASRRSDLYAEGAHLLRQLWDETVSMVYADEFREHHSPRATLAYARVLLAEGDVLRATRAVQAVLALQETREEHAHVGNFRWHLEDPGVEDLNGVEFMLDQLIPLARDHASALPAATLEAMRDAIRLGLAEINRLDVHLSYTNIALSDISNSILGGELLDDAQYVERGARRLDRWLAFTNASGAPHEFNSPTYAAVDILRLATLATDTRDATIAFKARVAEERLWLHFAAHYHPGLAQIAGPHSRAYFDGWSGAGGLQKLVLWCLIGDDTLRAVTPYTPAREEGHLDVALTELHCPAYIERWLRQKNYPFEARETTDAKNGVDITTHMTDSYALGSASRSYGVGEPQEQWPGFNSLHLYARRNTAPGYGALYVRYVMNDHAPGKVAGSGRRMDDHWDEGEHVAVQHRNRAIIAYAPLPRLRPAHSYKLSIRLLGVAANEEVWAGDRRIGTWPCRIGANERVVVSFGDVYVALVSLAPTDMGSGAPIELHWAEGSLTLDIYNYRGPSTTFWDHRSRRGPFFKGVARNGLALEVAERGDFADVATFRRHIADARVTDNVDAELRREIVYASNGGDVALSYSLRDMKVLERRIDGVVYAPPPSVAGALDGAGAQFAVSFGGAIEVGRTTARSGDAPLWLFADDDARTYVLVKCGERRQPLTLRTGDTVVECSALAFARIEFDERAGTLRVETPSEPGEIRVHAATPIQLLVNGAAAAASPNSTSA